MDKLKVKRLIKECGFRIGDLVVEYNDLGSAVDVHIVCGYAFDATKFWIRVVSIDPENITGDFYKNAMFDEDLNTLLPGGEYLTGMQGLPPDCLTHILIG